MRIGQAVVLLLFVKGEKMTKEEIIEMAKQCGLIGMRPHLDGIYSEELESFAKLVVEKAMAELKADIKINQRNLLQKLTRGQE